MSPYTSLPNRGQSKSSGQHSASFSPGKRASFLGYRRNFSSGRRGFPLSRSSSSTTTSTYTPDKTRKDKTRIRLVLLPLSKWYEITKDPWILETISGYHVEFSSPPFQSFCPTSVKFAESESITVEAEIQSMLEKGAIEMVQSC